MKFLRRLFKDKKGSGLVEKIMVTAFAVAAGGAVILWTSNVIIESKNKPISGILDGDGGTLFADEIEEGSEGLQWGTIKIGKKVAGYQVTGYEGSSSTITIPSRYNDKPVKSIGVDAFGGNETIQTVIIGSGGRFEIKDHAFEGCSNLKNITLPSDLGRIECGAFECCGMSSIHLPGDIAVVEAGVFTDCDNLTDIYCVSQSKPDGWNDNWLSNCSATVHWGS